MLVWRFLLLRRCCYSRQALQTVAPSLKEGQIPSGQKNSSSSAHTCCFRASLACSYESLGRRYARKAPPAFWPAPLEVELGIALAPCETGEFACVRYAPSGCGARARACVTCDKNSSPNGLIHANLKCLPTNATVTEVNYHSKMIGILFLSECMLILRTAEGILRSSSPELGSWLRITGANVKRSLTVVPESLIKIHTCSA